MVDLNLSINTNLACNILTGFIKSEITRVGISRAIINLSGGLEIGPAGAGAAQRQAVLDDLPVIPDHLAATGAGDFAPRRPRQIIRAQLHFHLLDPEEDTVRHDPVGCQLLAALVRYTPDNS